MENLHFHPCFWSILTANVSPCKLQFESTEMFHTPHSYREVVAPSPSLNGLKAAD